MTALLEARDVHVDLHPGGFLARGRTLNVLSGVTLTLRVGETLALVGESGSGKTTFARAVLGLQPISGGTVSFAGREVSTRSDYKAIRRETAMMFQDAVASLSPRMRIGSLVTEPYVIHAVPLADRRARAVELLGRVGLPAEAADRFPHELSGGQARRAGVARALALEPKLVVADEPTAGLDVSVQAEILNLMADLKERHGLAYLIITHNLALVRHVADRIAVMYLGRVVENGPTAEVFARPLHPYTASLIAAEPRPDPRLRRRDLRIRGEIPSILHRPPGCEFHTRCAFAEARCRNEAPALRTLSSGREARCHFAETIHKNQPQGDMRHAVVN